MSEVIGAQSTVAVFLIVLAIDAGELITSGKPFALGTCVCATLMMFLPTDGDETTYGRLPLLPAAVATMTPASDALFSAAVVSSSFCPYAEPIERFATSTWSEMSPSWLGSIIRSIACSIATPLQLVETELQTLYTSSFAPGATPGCGPMPATMSDTWVPWPPAQPIAVAEKSIGSSSWVSGPFGHVSPVKSNPSTTFDVGNRPSRCLFFGSA